MTLAVVERDGGVQFAVKAVPGSSRERIVGLYGDALKVRLAAPPVDGKANQALQVWLAASFGLRQKQVELLSGQTSRTKVWALHCADEAELRRCEHWLQQAMAPEPD